ncbi:MAG: SpoIIIAC/SpoIIIAD family protein [Oscillospiraceae bacterium]
MTAVAGAAVIAAVLAVTLREVKKEYALLLSLACGILLLLWAANAIAPALDELRTLIDAARIDTKYGEILLKSLGVSFLTQFAADACKDAGEGAIAAKLELCGRVCIVALSLPMFQEILSLAGSMFSL